MRFLVFSRIGIQKAWVSGPHACISVHDSDAMPARLPENPECVGVLRLAFDDVVDAANDKGRDVILFGERHAKAILLFWEDVRHRIGAVVIHCNGGVSRSPAIAAALERIETGHDDRWFETKALNRHVYRTLLETYHITQRGIAP